MTRQATGSFDIERWDSTPYDEREGLVLARVDVAKTFHGDLEGTGEAVLTTATTPVEGSMAYVAIERVIGTLHGRSGQFLLQHSAVMERGGAGELWLPVVPDSGTGGLTGLKGRLRVDVDAGGKHTYVFEYDLP